MVVKDGKDFHTCGIMDPKPKLNSEVFPKQNNEVHISYEPHAEIVPHDSNEYEGEQDINQEIRKKTNEILKKNYTHQKFNIFSETIAIPSRNSRIVRSADKVTHMEGFLHGKSNDSDSSQSSFEQSLTACHEGRILLHNKFPTSSHCINLQYLQNQTRSMQIQHNVHTDGYYFYIFYSDNDDVKNEVHAVFDIFKPTYEYSPHVKSCLNKTECTFPIYFLSTEKVVVEIPVRDGIEHETDDITLLISTCEPRKIVYAAFTVTVLILIFLFAFM